MKTCLLRVLSAMMAMVATGLAADKDTEKKTYESLFKSILVKVDKYDRTILESIADGGVRRGDLTPRAPRSPRRVGVTGTTLEA